jgi:hypothetical protein
MHEDDRSGLPQPLRAKLRDAARDMDRGVFDPADASALKAMIAELPLVDVARAMADIRMEARLWSYQPLVVPARGLRSRLWGLLGGKSQGELLKATADLAYLYLFHSSGYWREAALARIHGPLPGAFVVAAIVYRLNDWVPQVRQAAAECLSRTAGLTDPRLIAAAGMHMLVQTETWRRWRDEAQIFDEALAIPDVARLLAGEIAVCAVGPAGRILRATLRRPAMDAHLPDLLRGARHPSVRAVALRTLLDAKARWPWGTEKKWIDKSLGRYRMDTAWRERAIERPLPLSELLEIGARDPATAVRKVAASGLIAHFDREPIAPTLAGLLVDDRSRTVRERARFALDRAARAEGEA